MYFQLLSATDVVLKVSLCVLTKYKTVFSHQCQSNYIYKDENPPRTENSFGTTYQIINRVSLKIYKIKNKKVHYSRVESHSRKCRPMPANSKESPNLELKWVLIPHSHTLTNCKSNMRWTPKCRWRKRRISLVVLLCLLVREIKAFYCRYGTIQNVCPATFQQVTVNDWAKLALLTYCWLQ